MNSQRKDLPASKKYILASSSHISGYYNSKVYVWMIRIEFLEMVVAVETKLASEGRFGSHAK